MVIASPILMRASEAGPLTDQQHGGGSREDQAGQEMTDLGGRQFNERGRSRERIVSRVQVAFLNRDPDQKGSGEQDEGEMTVPANEAAHFILIQAQPFAGLQILFNVPSRANGLHDGGQQHVFGGENQVIGQGVWVVKAATDDQEVLSIHRPGLCPGQDGPVKEPVPFGALTLTEPVPVAGAQGRRDAAHIPGQTCLLALHTDDLGRGDGQGIAEALRFQEGAQVRAMAVDCIGNYPVDRQVGLLGALDHVLGQFGFGAKADAIGNVGSLPARQVGAPVFGQV